MKNRLLLLTIICYSLVAATIAAQQSAQEEVSFFDISINYKKYASLVHYVCSLNTLEKCSSLLLTYAYIVESQSDMYHHHDNGATCKCGYEIRDSIMTALAGCNLVLNAGIAYTNLKERTLSRLLKTAAAWLHWYPINAFNHDTVFFRIVLISALKNGIDLKETCSNAYQAVCSDSVNNA